MQKSEITQWYSQRHNFNLHLKLIHCRLHHHLSPLEFDTLDIAIGENIDYRSHEAFLTQRNKLYRLIETKSKNEKTPAVSSTPTNFYNRLVNLSNTQLSPEEEVLLYFLEVQRFD
jgi:hypothetical protein